MNKTIIDNLVNGLYYTKKERIFTVNVFENPALGRFVADVLSQAADWMDKIPIFEHFAVIVVDDKNKKIRRYCTLDVFSQFIFDVLCPENDCNWKKTVKHVHEMPYFLYDIVLTLAPELRKKFFPSIVKSSTIDPRLIGYSNLFWPETRVYCIVVSYLAQILPLGRWFSVVSHTLTKTPNSYKEIASNQECDIDVALMLYVNFIAITDFFGPQADESFKKKRDDVCGIFSSMYGESTEYTFEKNFCLTEPDVVKANPLYEPIVLCLADIESIIRQYIHIDTTLKEINGVAKSASGKAFFSRKCSIIKISAPLDENASKGDAPVLGQLFESFVDALRDYDGDKKKKLTSRYAQHINSLEEDPFSSTFSIVKCALDGFSFDNPTSICVEGDGYDDIKLKDVSVLMDNVVVSALPREWLYDRQLKGENMLTILRNGIAESDGHALLWHIRFVQMFYTKDVVIFQNLVKCLICYFTSDAQSRNFLLSHCSVNAIAAPDDAFTFKVLINKFAIEEEKTAKEHDRIMIAGVLLKVFIAMYSGMKMKLVGSAALGALLESNSENTQFTFSAAQMLDSKGFMSHETAKQIIVAVVNDLLANGHVSFRDAISTLDSLVFVRDKDAVVSDLAIVQLDQIVFGQSANSIVRSDEPHKDPPKNIKSLVQFFGFIECVLRGLSGDMMHKYNSITIDELIKNKTFMKCKLPLIHLKGRMDSDVFKGCSRNDFVATDGIAQLAYTDALYGINHHMYQYMKQFDRKLMSSIEVHLGAPKNWVTSEFGARIQ